MTQGNEASKSEVLLEHIVRGGIKAIPLLGALLEETLYGAMDEIEAREQAARIMQALEEIQSGVDSQSTTLVEVLAKVNTQVEFLAVVASKIDELVTVFAALGKSPIPESLRQPIERALDRVGSMIPLVWNVPHQRNVNFTGREAILTNLEQSLASGKHTAVTQAIAGLGGVGKTQIAVEYAYRHAFEYEVVWWVRSETTATLGADYASIAGALGLPEKNATEQQVVVDAVRLWLREHSDWLLVFDNAENVEDISPYLPLGASGHVLITSRNQVWGRIASPLPLHEFERDESVDFLRRRTRQDDEEAADALAEELGDLPLALEQAAAYIEVTGQSFAGYLALFKERRQTLMERGAPPEDEYQYTIATTWGVSFERVEKEPPVGADMLRLMAFLAPDGISRSIISEGAEHLPERLAAAVGDALLLDEAIAALRRYSLVETEDEMLSVHRLVQAVVRDGLNDDETKVWASAAVEMVNDAYPYERNNVETWAGSLELLPHALAAAGHAEVLKVAPEATGRLLNQVGLYLNVRAQYDEAKAAHERALAIGEESFGPNHPEVATLVNNLGYVLREQGDLGGAREHYERALAIDEATYGPNHPTVALRVNNLGHVLLEQGDLEGAREHLERALAIGEESYGPNHPDVAAQVNNLGRVLLRLGDLERARERFERALSIFEKTYGPNHPNVATLVNNLGSVLLRLGDLKGAREQLERALTIGEKSYGPNHPTVALRVNNLGRVLFEQGDLKGAREHYERALRIFQEFLGDEHPNTVTARDNLHSL